MIKQPPFELNGEPHYDVIQIQKMLPHRPPFLFVDKILEIGEDYVVGVKNVTMNEPFFVGHFPGEPIMPAVIQIEAMAQTGGILALNIIEEPHKWSTYFLKIDGVKLRKKVVPGDTIVFALELVSPLRRGICQMKGKAYVGNEVVMEAELMAQLVKNKE